AAGHYVVRVPEGAGQSRSEMDTLAASFNSMADRLQQVVGDLEDRNARLDVILNAMSDPLLAVTPDTTVTYMNKASQETFGRKLDPAGAAFPIYLLTHCA